MMALLVPFKVILSFRPPGCVCVCVRDCCILIRKEEVCPCASAYGQKNLVDWRMAQPSLANLLNTHYTDASSLVHPCSHPYTPMYTQVHTPSGLGTFSIGY